MANLQFNFTRKNLRKAGIYLADKNTQRTLTLGQFFLNPTTWTESKSTNWVKQNVPGTSDPHQQWVSGGARTVSFEAFVTNDLAEGHVASSSQNSFKNTTPNSTSIIKRVGAIALKTFNISGTDLGADTNVRSSGALDLDITDKLNYYRSLCYPNLTTDKNRVDSAPPFVILDVGPSLGNRTQSAKFVVDKVDITITKQHPDLTPIEAKVTFTLTEFVDGILGANNNIISDI